MVSANTSQKRQKKYPLRTLSCSSAQGNLLAKAGPKPKSIGSSSFNVPIRGRKWIDIDPQPFDRSCFKVPKFRTRTLRHESSIPREEDGAVRFDDLIEKLKEKLLVLYRGQSKLRRILWHKEEERRKGFNTA